MAGTRTPHGKGKDPKTSTQLEPSWETEKRTTENDLDNYSQKGLGKHRHDLGGSWESSRRQNSVEKLCRPMC
jgi:hypothetical protein